MMREEKIVYVEKTCRVDLEGMGTRLQTGIPRAWMPITASCSNGATMPHRNKERRNERTVRGASQFICVHLLLVVYDSGQFRTLS